MAEYNDSFALKIEADWNEPAFRDYLQHNWTNSIVYSLVYVVVVFGGRVFMNKRTELNLRPVLVLWSGTLAIFSICGTVRTVPAFFHTLNTRGLQYSICDNEYYKNHAIAFWSNMFAVSKVCELGDTLFIVLRKQRLMFLHWYHHVTVLVYVWCFYPAHDGPMWWFMVMNYIVHSFMYSYYTLRALRVRVPKYVSVFITTLQLIQMFMGLGICIVPTLVKSRGGACMQSFYSARYGVLMYGSYLILFARFFYTAYIAKPDVSYKKLP